jgi:hypothetical protein
MTRIDDLWEMEKSFWLNGVDFYRQHMGDDAIMIFAEPVGILQGKQIISSLEGAPRWQAVQFAGQRELQTSQATVLAYRATGLRPDAGRYEAFCSSTYVRRNGTWMLVAHQQTPL